MIDELFTSTKCRTFHDDICKFRPNDQALNKKSFRITLFLAHYVY